MSEMEWKDNLVADMERNNHFSEEVL